MSSHCLNADVWSFTPHDDAPLKNGMIELNVDSAAIFKENRVSETTLLTVILIDRYGKPVCRSENKLINIERICERLEDATITANEVVDKCPELKLSF